VGTQAAATMPPLTEEECVTVAAAAERLLDTLLSAATDNDRVRVNAARALGYLASRGPPEVLRVGGACFAVASARLPQVTDALLACVSSPAVKVRWNVCCALGGTLQRHRQQEDLSATAWAPAAVRALLTLLRESSNFKVTAGSCLSSTRL